MLNNYHVLIMVNGVLPARIAERRAILQMCGTISLEATVDRKPAIRAFPSITAAAAGCGAEGMRRRQRVCLFRTLSACHWQRRVCLTAPRLSRCADREGEGRRAARSVTDTASL